MKIRFRYIYLVALLLQLSSLQAVEKHDKFVVVTPPKAGTHLLTKAVEQLTGLKCHNIFSTYELSYKQWSQELRAAEKNNCFIQIHGHPRKEQIGSLKKLGYKVLFLIRDPRDQAISLYFFIRQKNWALGPLRLDREPYKSLSEADKIHEIITGLRTGFSGVSKLFSNFVPWAKQPAEFVLTSRFEDLVGEEGGGSRARQLKAVTRIARFLHLPLSPQQIDQRSQGLFGKRGEKTFRKAEIGNWRYHFSKKDSLAMKRLFGLEMKLFGYKD